MIQSLTSKAIIYSMKSLYRAYGWIIWVVSILALFSLFIAALFFTCSLSQDVLETTYFHKTSLISYVLAFVIFGFSFFAFFWLEKRFKIVEKLREDSFFLGLKRVIYITLAAFLFVWLISTQFTPVGDQLLVQWSATEIASGDFSSCEDEGYLGTYPFQFGLVWFSCLLGMIFGFNNFLAFQLVNIFAFLCVFYCLVEFGKKIGIGRTGQICILLLAFLFYPFAFMVSFVYGNLIGLALSLLAILYEFKFFEQRNIKNAVFSALFITLAIFIKANYQVFLIGIILAALACALKEKTIKVLLVVALSLFGFVAQGFIAISAARLITGEQLNQGIGATAYIAMGLHDEYMERPHAFRTSGWYDDSTVTAYNAVGADSVKLKEWAANDTKASIDTYLSDPNRAARFAAKKFVSQWCNPDFQCIWNIKVMITDVERPLWSRVFTSEKGQDILRFYLKALQLCIEFLVIVCLIVNRKEFFRDGNKMLLLLILIGGMLCHMIWEAKAQYTVTYYVLLFPYAVRGAQDITKCIRARLAKRIQPAHIISKEVEM